MSSILGRPKHRACDLHKLSEAPAMAEGEVAGCPKERNRCLYLVGKDCVLYRIV